MASAKVKLEACEEMLEFGTEATALALSESLGAFLFREGA
jgi:hypothetical protein